MKLFRRYQDIIVVVLIAVSVILLNCGKDEEPLTVLPWEANEYSFYEDSALQRLTDGNDTLAAMTLAWHYLQFGDTLKAARFITEFNRFYSQSTPELNYLTGIILTAARTDSLALPYLETLKKSKIIPQARHTLANTYKNLNRYEDAINIYKKLPDHKNEAIRDSILRCRADMGDTLSGIEFAQKMLKAYNIGLSARYFSKYVSLQRGKFPAEWCYGAGEAYMLGNNFTRAAVYLENADADIDEARLSNMLGRTYFRLEVYDSCASKLNQALSMGDSTLNNIYLLHIALVEMENESEASRIAELGRTLFPADERFYFYYSQLLYKNKKYKELNDFVSLSLNNAPQSFKLHSYYIGSYYLMGDNLTADSLLEIFIDNFRYVPYALKEAARFFEQSLKREDIGNRLKNLEISENYPEVAAFITHYDNLIKEDLPDSALSLLNLWLVRDTVPGRCQIIEYLRDRDFPNN